MRRILIVIGLLALLIGWPAAMYWGVPAWLQRGAPATVAAPDPATPGGWLVRPDTPPPAVWEDGWAIDFIILPAVPDTLDRHGLLDISDETVRTPMAARLAPVMSLLEAAGPSAVYMPALRLPSAATERRSLSPARSDLRAALAHYFEADNRGRAVAFIVPPGASGLLQAAGEAMRAEGEDVAGRTVGVLALPGAQRGAVERFCEGLSEAASCRTLEGLDLRNGLPAPLRPALPGRNPGIELADAEAAQADARRFIQSALAWLERDVAKRAEPLGGFEVIEVTPVRRPGETERDATADEPPRD